MMKPTRSKDGKYRLTIKIEHRLTKHDTAAILAISCTLDELIEMRTVRAMKTKLAEFLWHYGNQWNEDSVDDDEEFDIKLSLARVLVNKHWTEQS